jgi:hypothetical protein
LHPLPRTFSRLSNTAKVVFVRNPFSPLSSLAPAMSNNAQDTRCHCGKTLKDSQAMMQHRRDSPRHQQSTTASPPSPGENLTCTCGRLFKTAEALHQHKRNSPSHAKRDTIRDTGEVTSTSGRSAANNNWSIGTFSDGVGYHAGARNKKQLYNREEGGIVSLKYCQLQYSLDSKLTIFLVIGQRI